MLRLRVLTATVLTPLAILAILLPGTKLFALFGAVAFSAALWEWTMLSGLKATAARIAVLVGAALIFALLWHFNSSTLTSWVLAAGVAWWLLTCLWLRHFAFAAAPTRENRALKLVAGALVIFPAWIALLSLHSRNPNGPWWVLLAFVIVWTADIGAYFSGRTWGKRKLAPQISPGKTWAGAYGALVAGVLVTLLGAWLLDVRDARLIGLGLLGLVTVAASIVGDLAESLMKRHAQVKDSGNVFPGHGGLMDRLDSLFAALPVFASGLLLVGV